MHGLRLGEVHLAIEEGAPGELPRLRGARAAREQEIENAPGDKDAAMALNLDHILAGVAGRARDGRREHLVEHPAAIGDAAKLLDARRQFGDWRARAKDVRRQCQWLRPAQAQDGDRPLAKRRRDGGDGILGMAG